MSELNKGTEKSFGHRKLQDKEFYRNIILW